MYELNEIIELFYNFMSNADTDERKENLISGEVRFTRKPIKASEGFVELLGSKLNSHTLNIVVPESLCDENIDVFLDTILKSLYTKSYLQDFSQGYFIWNESSCYLDSLLMVLFFGNLSFVKKNILEKRELSNNNYNPKMICKTASLIQDPVVFTTLALEIQNCLEEYSEAVILNNATISCTKLRHLLAQIYPSMKNRGRFSGFNVSEIYALFVDIFPELAIKLRRSIYKNRKLEYTKETTRHTIFFADFMMGPHATDTNFELLDFENINSPLLVFENGKMPPFEKIWEVGNEEINFWGISENVTKIRCFSERILNKKYRLSGLIFLEPLSSHYFCCFRILDCWYLFNGLARTEKIVIEIDFDTILSKTPAPDLLFYEKI